MTKNLLRLYIGSLVQEMATRYRKEKGENLPRWQEKLKKYEEEGGYHIHFSYFPKLGVNPMNEFITTPTGFYTYQLNTKTMKEFGIDRPYAIVVKPNPDARILELESYTDADLARDLEILRKKYPDKSDVIDETADLHSGDGPAKAIWKTTQVLSQETGSTQIYRKPNMAWNDPHNPKSEKKTQARQRARDLVKSHASRKKGGGKNYKDDEGFKSSSAYNTVDEPGPDIGPVRRYNAAQYMPSNPSYDEIEDTARKKDTPVNLSVTRWTKILMDDLGYDGARDGHSSPGQSIIHKNEPTQAVFFDVSSLEHVDTIKKPVKVQAVSDLTRIPQSSKDLSGQDLTGKEELFRRNKFIGTNFEGANASNMSITECDLSRTNCSGTNFSESSIISTKFVGSNLQRANFRGSSLTNITFENTNLAGAIFDRFESEECEYTQANMTSTSIKGAKFIKSWFFGANMERTDLSGTVFEDCFFGETKFSRTNLTGCKFLNCDFTDATFARQGRYDMNTLGLATFINCTLPDGIKVDEKGKLIPTRTARET